MTARSHSRDRRKAKKRRLALAARSSSDHDHRDRDDQALRWWLGDQRALAESRLTRDPQGST